MPFGVAILVEQVPGASIERSERRATAVVQEAQTDEVPSIGV